MTPVKQRKAEVAPLLFPNKKGTIEFEQVIDQVKDALAFFDNQEPGVGTCQLTLCLNSPYTSTPPLFDSLSKSWMSSLSRTPLKIKEGEP